MGAAVAAMHNLLTLRIDLNSQGGVRTVGVQLQKMIDGDMHVLGGWCLDAADAERPSADRPLIDPLALESIADAIRSILADFPPSQVDPSEPLWLHFVKPYGLLGAASWERALGRTGRAVLRIPDFLEPPREASEVLEAVLCCDLQAKADPAPFIRLVTHLAAEPFRPRQRLNLFVGGVHRKAVLTACKTPGVWVAPAPLLGDPRNRNGWLAWIEEGMKGRAVDLIHFAAEAKEINGHAALIWSNGPAPGTPHRFLRAEEIVGLRSHLGAWATGFTPLSPDDRALRAVADEVAQMRPGAAFYQAADPSIAAIYRALFSGDATPPLLSDGFLVCQPALLQRGPANHAQAAAPGLFARAAHSVLVTMGRAPAFQGNTTSWEAAANRFIEQATVQSERFRAHDMLLSDVIERAARPLQEAPQEAAQATSRIVDQTLSEMQAIVARYAARANKDA